MQRRGAISAIVCLLAAWLAGGATAAPCRASAPYDKWLAEFEREAISRGISQQAIAAAAPYLTYEQRIVNIDRGQRVFTQTFLEFSDRMAAAYRIQRGAALIKTYAPVFAKIDTQFGVPGPVIVSFWALESDFAANMGNYHTLSALASLAYDCRCAMAGRCRPTTCRLRYCCQWAASAPPSWPTIFASICSGTMLWSIPPRRLISRCKQAWCVPATMSARSMAFSA
jgi:membrane-bound lytic murein transglycosylase B